MPKLTKLQKLKKSIDSDFAMKELHVLEAEGLSSRIVELCSFEQYSDYYDSYRDKYLTLIEEQNLQDILNWSLSRAIGLAELDEDSDSMILERLLGVCADIIALLGFGIEYNDEYYADFENALRDKLLREKRLARFHRYKLDFVDPLRLDLKNPLLILDTFRYKGGICKE